MDFNQIEKSNSKSKFNESQFQDQKNDDIEKDFLNYQQNEDVRKIDNENEKEFLRKLLEMSRQNNQLNLKYQFKQNKQDTIKYYHENLFISDDDDDQIIPLVNQQKQLVFNKNECPILLNIVEERVQSIQLYQIVFQIQCQKCQHYREIFTTQIIDNKNYSFIKFCCKQQLQLVFKKTIKRFNENFLIGYVTIKGGINFKITQIGLKLNCSCMNDSQQIQNQIIEFENNKQTKQNYNYQYTKNINIVTFLCHGCCQELTFKPKAIGWK